MQTHQFCDTLKNYLGWTMLVVRLTLPWRKQWLCKYQHDVYMWPDASTAGWRHIRFLGYSTTYPWVTVLHTPGLRTVCSWVTVPYASGLQYRMTLGYSTVCPWATVPYAPGLQYRIPLGYSTACPRAAVLYAQWPEPLYHSVASVSGRPQYVISFFKVGTAPIILGLTTFLHFYIGVERGTKGLIPGYKNCSYTTGMC